MKQQLTKDIVNKKTKAFSKAVDKHLDAYRKKVEKIIRKAEARKVAELKSKLG